MRIVLDGMGSDQSPGPEVQAAAEVARMYPDEIFLVGPQESLRRGLEASGGIPSNLHLVHAPETITMEDKGLKLALMAKRPNAHNSMAVGMDLLKTGAADAFVTAGNTGGALATAYYRLGLIEGVERPALSGLFPVKNGHCAVLDIGANPDCKPEHIFQFAVMGSVYAEKVLGLPQPRVGLISNGEEPGKGNQLVKDSFPLLQSSGLNFIGNLEGKELFGGQADVAVTDGFTGNVLLKSSEAVAKMLVDLLREQLLSGTRTKIGALLARPAFDRLRKVLDPGEIGAAPLLGVNGLVFIGHGRSDAHALVSAVGTARQAVEVDLLEAIRSEIAARLQPVGRQVEAV
jgi:glycerol-3-phosphate acyltransferase PlsX